jgi:hypothetical protein
MLGWIREKMDTQKSALGCGRFSTSSSTVVGNGVSTCSDSCAPSEVFSIAAGNDS